MKRTLIHILPIAFIITVSFIVYGLLEVRFEENKSVEALEKRGEKTAERIEAQARYILLNRGQKAADRLVQEFQNSDIIFGCVLYDKAGKVVAATPRVSGLGGPDTRGTGKIVRLGDVYAYSYIKQVFDPGSNLIGAIEVLYDMRSMGVEVIDLWKRIGIFLLILLGSISVSSLVIQRRIFDLPVRRLTQWFSLFQRGETEKLRPFEEKGEFGDLVSEVEQVALSLRVARKAVTKEAGERNKQQEIWNESKLRDLVHAKLGDNALFVVSNREPYMHIIDEETGKPKWISPPSGVVTALDPILRACGGTWIAQGSTEIDRQFVNSKDKLGVPPDDIRYILKRVWVSPEEEKGYYAGFANEGLWPLCHVTHTRPIFREPDWQMYKKVNQKFADKILEELPSRPPLILIQDYHFTLLPRLIREKRPDATIALFWHIPWPNPEVFAICPYQIHILDGMLASDLIGFHLQYHCNNFLETVNRLLEARVDMEKFSVIRVQRETLVKPFPISVDANATDITRINPEEIEFLRLKYKLRGKIVAVGVDRIDYTKGLEERILAIDRFLEKYPEYKEKFVFLQLASPSRSDIERYRDLMAEVEELVDKKNSKYAQGDWKPIIYLKKQFSQKEIKPYYAVADICIVSSLHDGMNLVAKEYVAARKDSTGVLILSRFTGASRELSDAVLINPYSIEEFADAIKFAIDLPEDEKKKRMESMREVISENNIFRWAGDIITELTALKKE